MNYKTIHDKNSRPEEKQDPQSSGSLFSLAQSYVSGGNFSLALQAFEKRAAMGDDPEEVFVSLLVIGWLQENLQFTPETFINSYCKAHAYDPNRAEPLFRIAYYFFRTRNYILGYSLCKLALSFPFPQNACFFEHWIYDYGLLSLFAECACQIKNIEEGNEAVQKLLANPHLPPDIRAHIESNFSRIQELGSTA